MKNGFIYGLGLAILLAYFTPQLGAARGTFSLGSLAHVGVLLIFLFYGIGMSVRELWRGLVNWRVHLAVHLTTFLAFPLIVLGAYQLAATESTRLLWLGVFYVAALPSTVSSSVVMVSLARGNGPAAIFNASISSLLGVFLTPLWMSLFLTSQADGYDLTSAIRGLVFVVVLPVVLGMLLHPILGTWFNRNKKRLRLFDQGVVLLIVYTSFSDSFAVKAFNGFHWSTLVLLAGGMILLFFTVYGATKFACRLLGFNREDTITVLYCGSKKSLMHAAAMSGVIFAGLPNGAEGLGVVLLPIMLYHALQLVIVSVLARHAAR